MTKKAIMEKISTAINSLAIINPERMNINELLFALSRTDLFEPFVNVHNESNGEFLFGFAEGFWPVRHRALMVKSYSVYIDEETGSVAIEIKAVNP